MKRKLLLFTLLLILTGCNQAPPTNGEVKDEEEVIQNSGNYNVKIPLNKSEIKGLSLNTNAYINYEDMESELVDISKYYLNPNDFYYKPGEVLTADDVEILLQRESVDYPQGLNPKESKNIKDSPIYINTIIEHDYYTMVENKEKLNTIVFGFGIDTTYEYESGNDIKEVEITDEQIENFISQYISDKMINYIRTEKKLTDVDMVFAFYKESNDGLSPGYYYTYGHASPKDKNLQEVNTQKVEYNLYPNYDTDKKVDMAVTDLIDKVDAYYSYNTGISGYGKYIDDIIDEIHLEVIITSYSQIEIESLLIYIENNVTNDMLEADHLEIIFKSVDGEMYAILEYEDGKIKTRYVKE